MKKAWIGATCLGMVILSIAAFTALIAGCSSQEASTPPAPAPPVSVTLTSAMTGTGTGTITSNPTGINCGSTCTLTVPSGTVVTLTGTPDTNMTLASWSAAACPGTGTCTVTVSANLTVTATINQSTASPEMSASITPGSTGTGSITCNDDPCGLFPWGTSVTIAAAPDPGSFFAGWSGGTGDAAICTGTGACVINSLTVNSNSVGTFTVIPPNPTLTVTPAGTGTGTVMSAPAGINCGATCASSFAGGSAVTLTAIANIGSTFTGWSSGTGSANACSGTGTVICVMPALNQNSSVTATFTLNTAQFSVTPTSATTNGGGGSVLCSANGGAATTCGTYPVGTTMTLTATPNGASNFVGWSGATGGASTCSGTTNPCSFTLIATSTATATFDRPIFSATVTGTGGTVTSSPTGITCNSGSSCTQPFDKGTNVTLIASGAGFSGWSGGCSGAGTCQVTLTTDTTVTANFGGAGLPSFARAAFEAYVKASNTGASDNFGATIGSEADVMHSVALDGDTLVVGAAGEDSNAKGVGVGDEGQADNSATNSGAVYVFTRDNNGDWSQQAYLKPSNTQALNLGLRFGSSIALSGDTLAVGAYLDWSNSTGVNNDDTNTGAAFSGAVYVFTRDTNGNWSQQAYVKASNTETGDHFGTSVALSGDTLAVGAKQEDSDVTGVVAGVVGTGQTNNLASNSGAVYVFTRTGVVWSQQAYVKASNTERDDKFGFSVALSGDTLAVGAYREDSNVTGVVAGVVGTGQTNNLAPDSGAVYVFTRTGGVWSQQAYVKASNTGSQMSFGYSVALSGDTLAVGSSSEDSPESSGAVYVFTRNSAGDWSQQAYVKASNTGAFDHFGTSVALSGDTLAVGAHAESSNATLVNGDQTNNSISSSGAVYVFRRTGGVWSQQAYVKASNTGGDDRFGGSVALAGDTLAVGAEREDSAATGINGNQTDSSASNSGAVYVYRAQ